MTDLRRYNIVPMFAGQPTNHEYEEAADGQIVFADGAVTKLKELRDGWTEASRLLDVALGERDDAMRENAKLRGALELVKAGIPQLVFTSPSSRNVAELMYGSICKTLLETK
jgi:hypothetical protein